MTKGTTNSDKKRRGEISCIQLSNDVKRELAQLGSVDETYETVIRRLIKEKGNCTSTEQTEIDEEDDNVS